QPLLHNPNVRVEQQLLLIFVCDGARHNHALPFDDVHLCGRFRDLTVVETVQEVVRRLSKKLPAGLQEVTIVFDPPKITIEWNPMRGQDAWILVFDGLEILVRRSIGDLKIGFLCQEGKVGQRIDLRTRITVLVELCLRKDVMHLQTAEVPEQMVGQFNPRLPITRAPDPCEHVSQRIKACAATPSDKVVGTQPKVTAVTSKLLDKAVEGPRGVGDVVEVLAEFTLGGSGISTP